MVKYLKNKKKEKVINTIRTTLKVFYFIIELVYKVRTCVPELNIVFNPSNESKDSCMPPLK